MKIIVASLCNFLQKTTLIACRHGRVEASGASTALFLTAAPLGVEMIVPRDARDDFTALGDTKTL